MVQEQEQGRSGKHFVEAPKVVKIPKMVTLCSMRDNNIKMDVVALGTMVIMLKKDCF